jgi:hypothetical protein
VGRLMACVFVNYHVFIIQFLRCYEHYLNARPANSISLTTAIATTSLKIFTIRHKRRTRIKRKQLKTKKLRELSYCRAENAAILLTLLYSLHYLHLFGLGEEF